MQPLKKLLFHILGGDTRDYFHTAVSVVPDLPVYAQLFSSLLNVAAKAHVLHFAAYDEPLPAHEAVTKPIALRDSLSRIERSL